MARKLHVARVWQIEYKYPGMYGGDGQDIFYDILTMFEVDNSAEDAYTDDFEIARSGLQQLRKHISEQDETFRQNAEEFIPAWQRSDGPGKVYRSTRLSNQRQ